MEEAAVVGHAVLEEVIVEGEGGHVLDVRGVVAGPAGLDWGAVGAAGAARPVEGRLQRGVVGVVLGHAPELRRAALISDRRRRVAEGNQEEEEHTAAEFEDRHFGRQDREKWREQRERKKM